MKVLIDGNNVFRYNDGYNVSYLEAVFLALDAKRIDWFCFADANLPYLVRERCSKDDQDLFTGIINKYSGKIQSAPSGKRADNFILQKADHENLNIVSNDRYSDYEDRYSWLRIRDRGGNYKDSHRRVYPFMFADGALQIEDLDVYWDMKTDKMQGVGKGALRSNTRLKQKKFACTWKVEDVQFVETIMSSMTQEQKEAFEKSDNQQKMLDDMIALYKKVQTKAAADAHVEALAKAAIKQVDPMSPEGIAANDEKNKKKLARSNFASMFD